MTLRKGEYTGNLNRKGCGELALERAMTSHKTEYGVNEMKCIVLRNCTKGTFYVLLSSVRLILIFLSSIQILRIILRLH
jgi:hypothetical protein